MICKKCNAQNKEESKICAMCGEQLDTDNQQNQVNSQNISNESVPVQNTNNTQLEGKITFDIVDRAKVTKADYIFKLIVLGDLGKFSLTIGKESERQS